MLVGAVSLGSVNGGNRLGDFFICKLMSYRSENRVADTDVQILNELHVVRGHDQTEIAKVLHLAALKSGESDCVRPCLTRHLQGVEDIGGIAATADGEDNVTLLHEIAELFGEDIFVARVIGPSGHHRNVVSQREYPEPPPAAHGCTLSQVTGRVGSQRSTSAIAKQVDRPILFVRLHQDGGDFVDYVVG